MGSIGATGSNGIPGVEGEKGAKGSYKSFDHLLLHSSILHKQFGFIFLV